MAMDAKKKAALIAGLDVEKDEKEPVVEDEEVKEEKGESDRLAFAKDVLAAFKSGKAEDLDAALSAYLECHS